jgi:hypothetical protein
VPDVPAAPPAAPMPDIPAAPPAASDGNGGAGGNAVPPGVHDASGDPADDEVMSMPTLTSLVALGASEPGERRRDRSPELCGDAVVARCGPFSSPRRPPRRSTLLPRPRRRGRLGPRCRPAGSWRRPPTLCHLQGQKRCPRLRQRQVAGTALLAPRLPSAQLRKQRLPQRSWAPCQAPEPSATRRLPTTLYIPSPNPLIGATHAWPCSSQHG